MQFNTPGKLSLSLLLACAMNSGAALSAPFSLWSTNGYTQLANDDGNVGPAGGGQAFDTESFYYTLEDNILTIGLQADVGVQGGHQLDNYYSDDLPSAFDGDVISDAGVDIEGLNSVSDWSNDIFGNHQASGPFAETIFQIPSQ